MTKRFDSVNCLLVILTGIFFISGCEPGAPNGIPFLGASKTPTLTQTPIPTTTPTQTITPSPTATLQPVNAGTPLPQSAALIQPETVDRLTKLADWEANSTVVKVLFSPNGELLASYSRSAYGSGQKIQIWRIQNGEVLSLVDVPLIANNHFSFSPDSENLIFVAGTDNTSGNDRWSSLAGKLVNWSISEEASLSSWGSKMTGFFLYENGEYIQTISWSDTYTSFRGMRYYHGLVTTYGYPSMNEIASREISSGNSGPFLLEPHPYLKDWGPLDFGGTVSRRTFSSDGKILAALLEDNIIELWDVQEGVLLSRCADPQVSLYEFMDIALSPDGKILATLGKTKGILGIWRVSDGKLLLQRQLSLEDIAGAEISLVSHRNIVRNIGPYFWLTFSPEGRYLSVAQQDFVQLWGIP